MDAMTPDFLTLMEDWVRDYSSTNPRKWRMYLHDFTTQYLCMKVQRKLEDDLEEHVCVAHLFVGRTKEGNGVEIKEEFIPAEDPAFFDRLRKRIDEKCSE